MKLFDSNFSYMLEQLTMFCYILINIKCEKFTRSMNFLKTRKNTKNDYIWIFQNNKFSKHVCKKIWCVFIQ